MVQIKPPIGISPTTNSSWKYPANDYVEIATLRNVTLLKVAYDTIDGEFLAADEYGLGIPVAPYGMYCAKALESGKAGDEIRVLVTMGTSPAGSFDDDFSSDFS